MVLRYNIRSQSQDWAIKKMKQNRTHRHGREVCSINKRNADIPGSRSVGGLMPENQKLRRNLEDDTLVLGADVLGCPVEFPLIYDDVAERVEHIITAGESEGIACWFAHLHLSPHRGREGAARFGGLTPP